MSLMVLHKFSHIYVSILESTRSAHDQWSRLAIDGTKMSSTAFINFSNHNTSNIPNLSNPTVNSSLASQTKCDEMFSDPESDHIFSHFWVRTWFIFCFLLYVVTIHLLQRGEGVGIYCPLNPD